MVWGDPDFKQLMEFMKDAYDERLTKMDHSHTRSLVSSEAVRAQIQSAFDVAM